MEKKSKVSLTNFVLNKVDIITSGLVFICLLFLVIFTLGINKQFSIQEIDNKLLIVSLLLFFSATGGLLVRKILRARLIRLTSHLQTINDAMSLFEAKRYEQVKEHLNTITDVGISEEMNHIANQLKRLASSMETVDDLLAKRVREKHSQSDDLRKQLDHVWHLISSAQMLILTVNSREQVQFFNRYAEDITGVPASKMSMQGVGNLFSPRDWQETQRYYEGLLSGQLKLAHQETEIIDADGQMRNIWWLHSMLDDTDEQLILSVGHDVTEEKGLEKRVVWLAAHDPLTNVLNANKFQEVLADSLNNAERYDKNNTIYYIHFDLPMYQRRDKKFTQQMADEMRVTIAETLQKIIRQTDTVARISEDDFVIIQPETTDESCKRFTEKLLENLNSLSLITPSEKLPVQFYIGIADYPYQKSDASELLAFSQMAAIRAKNENIQNSGFYKFEPNEHTSQELKQRVFWKKRIQIALKENLFKVHYQPIIDLKDKKTIGFEAYVRLADKGEIMPAINFIEIAEKQGLIEEVDHVVIDQVVLKAETVKRSKQIFFINLSLASLQPLKLLSEFKKLIEKNQVDGQHFVIEVSEKIARQQVDTLNMLMSSLEPLSIRLSIDDFGFDGNVSKYGFSSFSLFDSLPIDFIKINAAFTRELHNNPHDQLFVKTLVEEANAKGIKTIAESVENEMVMKILEEFGVNYAQGFFIGHAEANLQNAFMS